MVRPIFVKLASTELHEYSFSHAEAVPCHFNWRSAGSESYTVGSLQNLTYANDIKMEDKHTSEMRTQQMRCTVEVSITRYMHSSILSTVLLAVGV